VIVTSTDPDRPEAAVFDRIRYAQCWEDPALLEAGLEIGEDDDVLSVMSGGCNSLALALAGARSVKAVDISLPQVAVTQLKVAAIRCLDYPGFLELLGAHPSNRRKALYRAVRGEMTDDARAFWDAHPGVLERGVLASGKFEGYFRMFRTKVLPWIHGRGTIEALLEPRDLDGQRAFYQQRWNTWRWRTVFRVFFGRRVMGWLGRDPSFFRYVEGGSVGEAILRRTERALTEIPVEDNFFLHYILTETYRDLQRAHPYLSEAGFEALRGGVVDRVELIHADLWDYLAGQPDGSLSAFNLSDVFEYVSETVYEQQLHEIVRVARPGARLAYWNMMVPRSRPDSMADVLQPRPERAAELHAGGRAFFYGKFVLERVTP